MDRSEVPDIPQISEHPSAWRVFLPPILVTFICLIVGYYTNFIVFHSLIELFSVFIGLTAMTVAATTTQFTKNQFIVCLSFAAGWCASLDVVHVLVYQGIDIIPHAGGSLSTQLWIGARFLQSLSFLIAIYYLRHRLRIWLFNVCYGVLVLTIFILVFSGYFPQTYIENYGVTPFKSFCEWGIILILIIGLILLRLHKNLMSSNLLFYLTLSIITMIFSELSLSSYKNLYGLENIIAHILKIFYYWFIYIALVITTLRQPFNVLSRAASTYDNIPEPVFILQLDTTISQANTAAGLVAEMKPEQLVGLSSHYIFHDKTIPPENCLICSQLSTRTEKYTIELETAGTWLECTLSPIDSDLFPRSWVQMVKNITQRKLLEIEERKLLFTLEKRVKELNCLVSLSQLTSNKDITIEAIFTGTVNILPQAFQFPERIIVKIESKWGVFSSNPNTEKLPLILDKEFSIEEQSQVKIQIYYSTPPPESATIFFTEEAVFLDIVAALLTHALKQILSTQKATIAEHRFKESEKHFQAIIEQTGVGVYVRSKKRFLYVNPRFCEIVGRKKEELLTRGLFDLIDDESTKALILKKWDELDHGRSSITFNFPFKKADGTHLTLRADVTIIAWGGSFEYLSLVQDITEIEHAREQIDRSVEQLEQAIKGTFIAVSNMIEFRDPYTAGHERRVGLIAKEIGKELGWPSERCESLELIGLVHDIGKISIPAEILSKPTKLTPLEMELVKGHAQAGYDILKDVTFNAPVAEVIWQHHERLDGSGYPRGLKGNDILPETRIVSVADVLEAMSSHRPYRPALGVDAAIAEIRRGRGAQYDAEVVDAALKLINENKLPLKQK